MKLSTEFFEKDAKEIAKGLLGKYIVTKQEGATISGKIVETEAYLGIVDKASHAYNTKITNRTRVMFAGPGLVYTYFVYGIHWQLNFTCGPIGQAQCVLIRALETKPKFNLPVKFGSNDPNSKIKFQKLASGPAKVCNFLRVDGSFYGEDLATSSRIWAEDRGIKPPKISKAERVGIAYAKEWSKRKLRFYAEGSPSISA